MRSTSDVTPAAVIVKTVPPRIDPAVGAMDMMVDVKVNMRGSTDCPRSAKTTTTFTRPRVSCGSVGAWMEQITDESVLDVIEHNLDPI
jgi:hypothetical protein